MHFLSINVFNYSLTYKLPKKLSLKFSLKMQEKIYFKMPLLSKKLPKLFGPLV